jgi:hypothetical protein
MPDFATARGDCWNVSHDFASAATNHLLVAAPATGKALYITDIVLTNVGTAGTIVLVEDPAGTPAAITPTMAINTNSTIAIHLDTPIKLTAVKALGITSVSCVAHGIQINGYTADDA